MFKEGICNTFLSLGLQFLLSERDVVSFKYIGIATRKFSLLGQTINSLHFKSRQHVPQGVYYRHGKAEEKSKTVQYWVSYNYYFEFNETGITQKVFFVNECTQVTHKTTLLIDGSSYYTTSFEKRLIPEIKQFQIGVNPISFETLNEKLVEEFKARKIVEDEIQKQIDEARKKNEE